MFVGNLRAEAVYLVVAPRNAHQLRAKYLRADDFGGFEIGGMKIQERNPLRAACAATEFAKFPVEEQETTSNPNSRACARATATTRSLKLKVGRQTASFLM